MFELFPLLARAAVAARCDAVRRRAPAARHGARADRVARRCSFSTSRRRACRRCAPTRCSATSGRSPRRAWRWSSSSRTCIARWRFPTAPTCSSPAASRSTGRRHAIAADERIRGAYLGARATAIPPSGTSPAGTDHHVSRKGRQAMSTSGERHEARPPLDAEGGRRGGRAPPRCRCPPSARAQAAASR